MIIKKSILIISGALVVIVCICFIEVFLNSNRVSKEAGFFEKPVVDIGRVKAGVSQSVSFCFQNNEDESIRILEVKQSCSCGSKITFPNEPILPGQKGEVVIGKYIPKVGLKKANFALKLDNGNYQLFSILSKAYLDLFLSTNELRFPLVAKQRGSQKTVILMGNPEEILSLESIIIHPLRSKWLTVDVLNPEESGIQQLDKSYQGSQHSSKPAPVAVIRVKLIPGAPVGKFSEVVIIQVEDREKKTCELSFKCFGEIKEEVYVIPQRLIILKEADNDYHGEILLRSISDPFKIVSAESDMLNCDIVHNQISSNEILINVGISQNMQSKEGNVYIKIDHPNVSDISVPVKILYR